MKCRVHVGSPATVAQLSQRFDDAQARLTTAVRNRRARRLVLRLPGAYLEENGGGARAVVRCGMNLPGARVRAGPWGRCGDSRGITAPVADAGEGRRDARRILIVGVASTAAWSRRNAFGEEAKLVAVEWGGRFTEATGRGSGDPPSCPSTVPEA